MSSESAATVLVVDDDPQIRRSVSRLIQSAGLGVKTFASAEEFLSYDMGDAPACVVLDMCLGGMTGLQIQELLQQRERQIPIIFLSGHGTIPTAALGFKHGAEDFLEKPVHPQVLLDAVTHALDHDRSHAADRAEIEAFQQRFQSLTPREQEVMKLVVSGRLNKQAAAELGISEKTIKVHRARVMEKMRVDSLAGLVLVAGRIGLTPSPNALIAEARESWMY